MQVVSVPDRSRDADRSRRHVDRSAWRSFLLAASPRTLVTVAVGIIAFAFWLPYSLHAGFVYDDWSIAAGYQFHHPVAIYRPGVAVWVALTTAVFHVHAIGYYLSLAFLGSALAMICVVAFSELGLSLTVSAAISLLVAVSPFADSLGLWWAACCMRVSLILGMASIAAGARWVRRGPHARVWFGASLVLLVATVLTYESTAPIVFLPVALIAFCPDRRRLVGWFIPSAIAAGAASLFIFARSRLTQTSQPIGQYPSRISAIARSGTDTLLGYTVKRITLADLVVACLVAAALYVGWRIAKYRSADRKSWRLTVPSVVLLLAGTYLAWAPYVPANDYYLPSLLGVGNRVNSLAQVFFLAAVVLFLVTVANLFSHRSGAFTTSVVVAVGLFAALFASFCVQTHQDQQDYLFGKTQRQVLLTEIHQLLPRVLPGTEIILGDYYLYASPDWVPVLAAPWDTNGALELLYHDGSIQSQPMVSTMACRSRGLAQPSLDGVTLEPYRSLVVVDVTKHRVDRFTNQSSCRSQLPGIPLLPGPFVATSTSS